MSQEDQKDAELTTDRRRPGRVHAGNPHLIQLFRNPWSPEDVGQRASPAPSETDETDPLAAAEGIVLGVLISLALWAVVGFSIWYFFW